MMKIRPCVAALSVCLCGCSLPDASGRNQSADGNATFLASAMIKSFNRSTLELTVRVSPLEEQSADLVAEITLRNTGEEPITLLPLDPYLSLKDASSKAVPMTDFGLSHFFNRDKVGSVMSGQWPPKSSRTWTCPVRKCFQIPSPGLYYLDVSYSPEGSTVGECLADFGLAGVPIAIRQ
jgi:hypothetical protein